MWVSKSNYMHDFFKVCKVTLFFGIWNSRIDSFIILFFNYQTNNRYIEYTLIKNQQTKKVFSQITLLQIKDDLQLIFWICQEKYLREAATCSAVLTWRALYGPPCCPHWWRRRTAWWGPGPSPGRYQDCRSGPLPSLQSPLPMHCANHFSLDSGCNNINMNIQLFYVSSYIHCIIDELL